MKRKQFQFMILKNPERFSNQNILNSFLAISLDLMSWIVSKYLKFNLPKNLILLKQSFDFVSGIQADTMGKSPFLFYFSRDLLLYISLFYLLYYSIAASWYILGLANWQLDSVTTDSAFKKQTHLKCLV